MRRKYINVPFQLKELDPDTGRFRGLLSVFGNVDLGRDIVMPGAFADTLKEHRENGTMPALLWQHDHFDPIGTWEHMEETDDGLDSEGQLTLTKDSGQADVPTAWKARALMMQKAVRGLSIGYETIDDRWDTDEQVRELHKVNLWEGSIVTFPMNPQATVDAVKAALEQGTCPKRTDFIRLLRESVGLSRNQAERVAADGFDGLTPRKAVGPHDRHDEHIDRAIASSDRLLRILQGEAHA